MNLKKSGLIVAISATIVATGCHSSQELLEPGLASKYKQRPEFITDITLGANAKNISIVPSQHIAGSKSIKPSVSNVLQTKYAELLQVVPNAVTNFPLYNFIEEWYGVRYRMGGNDKSGIDCSAFVQKLYENVFCTNLVRTAFEQFSMCRYVLKQDSLEEGDLVFFKTRGRKRITHVGIYLMNNFFVHASSTQGVIISNLNEAYWSRFYVGAGKIPDKESSF